MSKSFLGIAVEGDVTRSYSSYVTQKPVSEFEPILRAVIDDPEIVRVGWTQYTPYFNDGEPCEFGANAVWVQTKADAERGDEEDGWEFEERLGLWDHPNVPKGSDLYARCDALADAIEDGAFDQVLLEAFGDHAEVTVSRDGITIEHYSHD